MSKCPEDIQQEMERTIKTAKSENNEKKDLYIT